MCTHRINGNKAFRIIQFKVNLDRHGEIVQVIKNNNNYRVPSQEFFRQIDALLDAELNHSQLTFPEIIMLLKELATYIEKTKAEKYRILRLTKNN